MPLFAFADAGVSLTGIAPAALLDSVPLGIAAGLIVGKQVGVFGFAWAAVKTGFAPPLAGATWPQVYGIACLAGIGFTMSLFIRTLAFDDSTYGTATHLGVLTGSLISAIIGYTVLRPTPGRGKQRRVVSRLRPARRAAASRCGWPAPI